MGRGYLQNMIVAVVVLALSSLLRSSVGYSIECLTVDFDCGDIGETLGSICKACTMYTSPGPTYVSRKRRSVEPSAMPFVNTPTPGLSNLPLDQQQNVFKMEMKGITLSPEEANMMLQSNPRFRRELVRKDPREECCSFNNFRRCVFEEVAEYCLTLHDGVNNCTNSG
uniref:Insulin-like androgenic gland hormone n=1 Tax=Pandalus platyceros TaxID=263425 RepID=A0A221LG04_PANPL|nr:insulin-like androgenic gland hormone [Pandalus platyceros]